MIEAGARSADRSRADVTMCCPVLVAAGDTQREIDAQRAGVCSTASMISRDLVR